MRASFEWSGRRHHRMGHPSPPRRTSCCRTRSTRRSRRSSTPSRRATASGACSTPSRRRRRRRSSPRSRSAFQSWIWSDPDRTDRLARLYNDTFNNIVPRHFNGDPSAAPGRLWRLFSIWAPEAGDLADHRFRKHLRRPRRRRRQDAVDRGRDHGAAPARPRSTRRCSSCPAIAWRRRRGSFSRSIRTPASSSRTRPIS